MLLRLLPLREGEAVRVELACCETTLLNEIADPAMKRADVALTLKPDTGGGRVRVYFGAVVKR